MVLVLHQTLLVWMLLRVVRHSTKLLPAQLITAPIYSEANLRSLDTDEGKTTASKAAATRAMTGDQGQTMLISIGHQLYLHHHQVSHLVVQIAGVLVTIVDHTTRGLQEIASIDQTTVAASVTSDSNVLMRYPLVDHFPTLSQAGIRAGAMEVHRGTDLEEEDKVHHVERTTGERLEVRQEMRPIRHHMAGSEGMMIPLSTEMVRSEDRADELERKQEGVL